MAILHMEFRSEALKRDVPVRVILPLDRGGRVPYPTLYLLHGLSNGCSAWVSNTRIQRWAEERNLAVVMPEGNNSFWVRVPPEDSVYGDFGKYVGEELVQLTREVFPLSHERGRTFIGGFSMGGYGALRNSLKYCDTFGKAMIFAAAAQFYETDAEDIARNGDVSGESRIFASEESRASDLNPRWLIEQVAATRGAGAFPKFKMITGEDDWLHTCNTKLAAALEEAGADVDFKLVPGAHNWDFANDNLAEMLDWLIADEGAHEKAASVD